MPCPYCGMPCPYGNNGGSMMRSNDIHHRRSQRLQGFDYSQPGAYFVTICTHNRACLFGDIVDGNMRPNDAGQIAEQCWRVIPEHFPLVILDAFVVMPNHLHGIVMIADGRGTACRAPTVEQLGRPVSGSIPTVVRSFKSAATKHINEYRQTLGAKLWQRNYHEHIIRDEDSLARIREYIINNPLQWALDRENPANTGVRHAVSP